MRYDLAGMIDTAAGRRKSELVLKNARIVNVFTQEIVEGDIALSGGKIAGVGRYEGIEEIDLEGRYAVPGLIDGHMHLESAMVTPSEFSRVVVPRGTTAVVADPHEIANVCGIEGIRYLLEQSAGAALDIFVMLPSCVPATPFDSSGARLDAGDMILLAKDERVLGLGELMDFRGVVNGRQDVLDKIGLFNGRIIDGHAPGLCGKGLNAYSAAGIRTEHECSTVDEMLEKLRLGFYILIREGSAAHNLTALIKGVNPANMRRCLFCTDDRHLGDIIRHGHIDNNIRLAVMNGMDPIAAVTMATLNTAECYGLKDRGAISPGYMADIVVLDDLQKFTINRVFKNGKLVAENGQHVPGRENTVSCRMVDTVRLAPLSGDMLRVEMKTSLANVVDIIPGSLATKKVVRQVSTADGFFTCIKDTDPVKLAVIERHKATGRVGLGLLDHFGLRNGAVASTISHDSHNLIVAGDNDEDMLAAIEELNRKGGGITICSKGKVVMTLDLQVAGLISQKPYDKVEKDLKEMLKIAHKMGVPENVEPFMTLSFLALTVIPEIRITDRGLFDVGEDRFIDITR